MLISITISWKEGRGHETCPVQRHFVMYGYPMLLGRLVEAGSACETIIQTLLKYHAAFCFIADNFLTVGGMQVAVHCYCSI